MPTLRGSLRISPGGGGGVGQQPTKQKLSLSQKTSWGGGGVNVVGGDLPQNKPAGNPI